MGFHFIVTTLYAFPFLRNKPSAIFAKCLSIVNFGLQIVGSAVLAYKIIYHIGEGMDYENSIELLVLTFPFTATQAILLMHPRAKSLGHVFYVKCLTLQMFPESMIVVSRDTYWLWGPHGLNNLYIRVLLGLVPMLPLYAVVLPALFHSRRSFSIDEKSK